MAIRTRKVRKGTERSIRKDLAQHRFEEEYLKELEDWDDEYEDNSVPGRDLR